MTLDRAVAIIAAHLGIVDEEQINSMSFVFFDDVLMELGYKLVYEALLLAGREDLIGSGKHCLIHAPRGKTPQTRQSASPKKKGPKER